MKKTNMNESKGSLLGKDFVNLRNPHAGLISKEEYKYKC